MEERERRTFVGIFCNERHIAPEPCCVGSWRKSGETSGSRKESIVNGVAIGKGSMVHHQGTRACAQGIGPALRQGNRPASDSRNKGLFAFQECSCESRFAVSHEGCDGRIRPDVEIDIVDRHHAFTASPFRTSLLIPLFRWELPGTCQLWRRLPVIRPCWRRRQSRNYCGSRGARGPTLAPQLGLLTSGDGHINRRTRDGQTSIYRRDAV